MSLMSDIGAVVKTKLDNKVNKVTSTDNAIVRFDGTTGSVQNSGVIIDDNNNVGIGVTPSAWSGTTAIQLPALAAISSGYDYSTNITNNAYRSGANYNYMQSGLVSTRYTQASGSHNWYTAPSGTAGNAITWTNAMTLDGSGNLQFNSGYGSAATAYGCRAWVNFNGTGTVKIRASGNISSITDNGTGDYTVNFTTAMPDANYTVTTSSRQDIDSNENVYAMRVGRGGAFSTTGVKVVHGYYVSSNVYWDCDYGLVSIFR